MNIRLPKKIKEYKGDAHIKDGILYVGRKEFEEMMYRLTYQIKGDERCYYCGRELTHANRSIDHLYPRSLGGVSIIDNLVPACKDCNKKKNNLNEAEFADYLQILKEAPGLREDFLLSITERHSKIRQTIGIELPQRWYKVLKDYEVLVPISSVDRYRTSKSYIRVGDLYETYGRICKTVMISKNKIVVDGFNALMYAKNLPIKVEVPFIQLDNVIVY